MQICADIKNRTCHQRSDKCGSFVRESWQGPYSIATMLPKSFQYFVLLYVLKDCAGTWRVAEEMLELLNMLV